MYTLKSRSIPLSIAYDVIVVGGGPAGCTAAASAAREGAATTARARAAITATIRTRLSR